MGYLETFLEIIGFVFGIPIGLLLGYFIFIYSEPTDVKDPIMRPLLEFDTSSMLDLLSEVPNWVKHPDYYRMDWLNWCVHDMWPYVDKAVCGIIKSTAEPLYAEYIGKFLIRSIYFQSLTLGNLPPTFGGIKVIKTNEKELLFDAKIRWAGNPNITLVLKFLFLPITIQLVDVQISASPRVVLKPLVPTFPCFSNIILSLLEKPRVDFGLKFMGLDIMAIPGLYHFVQGTIRQQISRLYLWPQVMEIPILDASVGAVNKPRGILHVKIIRAVRLLKMDFLGSSDPYVQLSLSGERLPAKKSSIKMKNLNPVWLEDFKLTVKDPVSQVLQLNVLDWEKVGTHHKLGMQIVPLGKLTPNETKEFTLSLVKNTNPNDPHNKKPRGQIMVECTYHPFREEDDRFNGPVDGQFSRKDSRFPGTAASTFRFPGTATSTFREVLAQQSGLLTVTVKSAEDVAGENYNNPYALITFKGELKRTKTIKKTRDPQWNEEFQFMLDEAPVNEKIHIEVMSKKTGIGLRNKPASLGYVDINLIDVVYNGRINETYNLINSRIGVIHVDISWEAT